MCKTHLPLLMKILTWNSKSTLGSRVVLPEGRDELRGREPDFGLRLEVVLEGSGLGFREVSSSG